MSRKFRTGVKTVFFVTSLDSGGIENYLLRFLKKKSDSFKHVIVFCKSGKGGDLEEDYLKLPNVNIVKIKVGNFHIHHYLKLYSWLRGYKDYTICDFTGNFAAPVLRVAKILQMEKRIVFYRSSSNRFKETFIRLKINNFYNHLILSDATNILANSNYAFLFYFKRTLSDSRFQTISNGVNLNDFLLDKGNLRSSFGIGLDNFVIGHTGRFNSAKNHQLIIDVADALVRRFSHVKFILCGRGVRKNLSAMVTARGLSDDVLLFENRSDISKFLNTCDAYLFPSLTEGQPNSLIEAWIKGIPFVASNIPPIKEITPHEFYDNLVDPNDCLSFVNKLSDIVNGRFSGQQRKKLSEWAKETFDAESRFDEFYSVLIS